jgi:hypothetical protein
MLEQAKSFEKPKTTCTGILNRCEDGSFILFIDYDKTYFHILVKELENLKKRFPDKLTSFAIFETTNSIETKNGILGNYHVVSFAKVSFEDVNDMLRWTTADEDFKKLPLNTPYKAWTLRVSPKFDWEKQYCSQTGEYLGKCDVIKDAPTFIGWSQLEDTFSGEISQAHLKFYKYHISKKRDTKLYDDVLEYWKNDGSSRIELKQYDSLGV